MKLLFVTIIGSLFFANSAFSMGGDKAGPNGGYITMPGTYHVELVDKGAVMNVYLLDLSMKNAITENSSVSLVFENDKKLGINCKAEENHFVCIKPSEKTLNFKEIIVESVRNKVRGKAAVYKLPLKFH